MSFWSRLRRALARTRRSDGPVPGPRVSYSPRSNGRADPGEVVWARVSFEDRPGEGKDRPVLIVGRQDRRTVLGLQLSSQERRAGQDGWLALGTGSWDPRGRKSFVRLDRVLTLDDRSIRREGAVLDQDRFRYVASSLRARHGWR